MKKLKLIKDQEEAKPNTVDMDNVSVHSFWNY